MPASYIESYNNGKLHSAAQQARRMLAQCCICPQACKVNRIQNETGRCKTGDKAKVFSFMAHHGEEPPVSGVKGSGTIFFSCCNMKCVYCQNYEFSQLGQGKETSSDELAEIMLKLQDEGCHNINLVSPTHVMPQILESLEAAIPRGLNVPIVYNTGGYEKTEAISLLEGIVDVYLVDMRYSNSSNALAYSSAGDYPEFNKEAVKLMHRQAGIARFSRDGIIERGVIIRHLVLPNNISGTEEIMGFIAKEISQETYISLMSQYIPYHKARQFPKISRRITEEEYEAAQGIMHKHGLFNGWIQESYGLERFAGVNIKRKI